MRSEDVVNFWMSFFQPCERAGLGAILREVSNTSLDALLQERTSGGRNAEDAEYFSDKLRDCESTKCFDYVTRIVSSGVKWIRFCFPIMRHYFEKVYCAVCGTEIIENEEEFLVNVITSLGNKLFAIYYETLVFEFHLYKFSEEIDSQRDVAKYFNDVVLSDMDYLKSIYCAYPELIRLLDLCVSRTVDFVVEILNKTGNKFEGLCKLFGDLGSLLKIEMGIGDQHNGGKSVARLVFERNRLIYKPRNLRLELAYRGFLNWVNGQKILGAYELKSCKVLSEGNCGWMEFVEYTPCVESEEVRRFYVRIGQLLCILYTLCASDFHHENLIAQKDCPVLVDLETILGNSLFEVREDQKIDEQAVAVINESVVKATLLPSRIYNAKNKKYIDIGGLSFSKPQESPFNSSIIENVDSDQVRVVRKPSIGQVASNNPVIGGNIVSSKQYINEIISGFNVMYGWILQNRKHYKAAVKKFFNNCEYRVVVKSTSLYWQMLTTSYHPDLLQNSEDRLVFLHRMALTHDINDKLQNKITAEEIRQLYMGDVPYFSSFPQTRLIYTDCNSEGVKYHNRSSFSSISKRIDALSDDDMELQNFLIKASYSLKTKNIVKAVSQRLKKRKKEVTNK